jgi:hypothetical protein
MEYASNTHRILAAELKEISFRRGSSRWEDTIQMDFTEIVWNGLEWFSQYEDKWRAFVKTIMDNRIPYNVRIFLTNRRNIIFPSRILFFVDIYLPVNSFLKITDFSVRATNSKFSVDASKNI